MGREYINRLEIDFLYTRFSFLIEIYCPPKERIISQYSEIGPPYGQPIILFTETSLPGSGGLLLYAPIKCNSTPLKNTQNVTNNL